MKSQNTVWLTIMLYHSFFCVLKAEQTRMDCMKKKEKGRFSAYEFVMPKILDTASSANVCVIDMTFLMIHQLRWRWGGRIITPWEFLEESDKLNRTEILKASHSQNLSKNPTHTDCICMSGVQTAFQNENNRCDLTKWNLTFLPLHLGNIADCGCLNYFHYNLIPSFKNSRG